MTRLSALTLAALLLLLGLPAPELRLAAATQVSVPTPVMGWASWNSFAANIDATVIKRQADAMVSTGLAAAGYQYINIDEGWWQGTRDASGNITVDQNEWPGGMAAIADYIHGKGLKAGIYTDAGRDGCGYYYPTGRPAAPGSGSEGHYAQDMLQFARWGFDFVKVDWCGGSAEGLDPQAAYRAISTAVAQASASTGRKLLLSICNWGVGAPWDWSPGLAPMWRTSTDIIYWGQTANQSMVLTNFDRGLHPAAQHTGYVNDPDMMIAGMPGLSAAQNRTHMNLWAISGAPLLLGANLTTVDTSALKNADVIAADQDPRGLQGSKVAEDSAGRQVYGKILAGSGKRAVVLLNRTGSAATMTVRWADLGLTSATATVRNAWTGQSTSAGTAYSVPVPAGDSVFLTVAGTDAAATTYEAESTANTRTGSAATATCPGCSGGAKVGNVGNGGTLRFNGVASANGGWAVATIAYVNGDATARTATLQVNGRPSTVVAFPPTGSWTSVGIVSVAVPMQPGTNTLTFANAGAWAPDLDAVEVRALAGGVAVTGTQSGRCVDVDGAAATNGAKVQLWDCNNQINQAWTLTGSKQLKVYGGKCLDAYNNGTANGTTVDIWDCNGQANQQWTLGADGTIRGVQSGLCVDAYNNGTANATKLVLWSCNGQSNQRWILG
ncbi:ricin-type beta-trefoil lectin domain protein [Dactylosporangium sp. CS-033363]|uniref:ricin-type beta-trefoil lectin domain protein n=1 Tax=Dactylosporangium sp. CS-033363 TaxID=3239935 RepID=UPI003D9215FC